MDPPDIDTMIKPPRDPKESVFTGRIKKMIFGIGILMPLAILPIFYLYNPVLTGTSDAPTPEYIHAMTMAFTVVVMFEMFNVYMCRFEKYPVFKIGIFKNKYLNLAVLSSILLQLLVLYIPVIEAVIDTTPLAIMDWLIVLVAGCIPLVAGEIAKAAFPPKARQGESKA